MKNILDKVEGWTEANTELRIHLLGWLATRTDDQILDDAVEMVGALEDTAHTRTITQMGENIMIEVVELCTMLMNTERPDNQATQDNTTTDKAEQSHILPGGSRLDTSLAVPVSGGKR